MLQLDQRQQTWHYLLKDHSIICPLCDYFFGDNSVGFAAPGWHCGIVTRIKVVSKCNSGIWFDSIQCWGYLGWNLRSITFHFCQWWTGQKERLKNKQKEGEIGSYFYNDRLGRDNKIKSGSLGGQIVWRGQNKTSVHWCPRVWPPLSLTGYKHQVCRQCARQLVTRVAVPSSSHQGSIFW